LRQLPGHISIVLLAAARTNCPAAFTPAMLPPTIRIAGLRRLLADIGQHFDFWAESHGLDQTS
jgi:hypothetical protein